MKKFRHQTIQATTTGGGGASSPYLPVLVMCICFGAYNLNGAPLPSNDQMANMLLSVNLLKRHSFTISLWQTPKVFKWVVERSPGKAVKTQVHDWNDEATELYRTGQLKPTGMPYFLTPTVHAELYANTFGIGAALTILPVYAVLNLFTDLASNHAVWWHGAKVTASLLTAGAALFIFLTMRRFVPPLPAVLGALAFGLGTCAWTLSSQALWQQTPYLFFLSLGAWCLGGVEAQPRRALYCGAAFGMATLCRPTGVIPVVLVGLYLLWLDPPRIIRAARDRVIENALDLGITSPRFLRVLGAAPDGGSREEDNLLVKSPPLRPLVARGARGMHSRSELSGNPEGGRQGQAEPAIRDSTASPLHARRTAVCCDTGDVQHLLLRRPFCVPAGNCGGCVCHIQRRDRCLGDADSGRARRPAGQPVPWIARLFARHGVRICRGSHGMA